MIQREFLHILDTPFAQGVTAVVELQNGLARQLQR
jgi:hypothetical protein